MLPVSLRSKIEIVGGDSQRRTRQAGNVGIAEDQERTEECVL